MIGRRLRELGVLGINGRNANFVLPHNPRRAYPEVDDKIRTKELCERAGVPVPRLIGAIRHHFELERLAELIAPHRSFVMKPARGSQGKGIAVVRDRVDDRFELAGRRTATLEDLRFRASEILSGLFSLGGQPDSVVIEECLEVDPRLAELSSGGVPDVRVLVYRGRPVMGMMRLPTRRSDGCANLHKGAVGVGVDLAAGVTRHAIWSGRWVSHHPDTGKPVIGVTLPHFPRLIGTALRAARQVHLAYLGVDLVVDRRHGPVVLELNARPGLSIQLANRAGLLPLLREADRREPAPVAGGTPLGPPTAAVQRSSA